MPEPLITGGDPCWGCEDRKYAGNGMYECLKGDSCELTEDLEWTRELVVKVAEAVAGSHQARRDTRAGDALDLANALDSILSEQGASLKVEAFLRRCGTPTLREAK